MRSLVLTLALAALLAPARPAAISQPDNFEKKLTEYVLDKDAQTPNTDDSDQANTIKDIDNQLLKGAPEAIPVTVVVEDVQPGLKLTEEKVEDTDVKRAEVDLKHPGEPEHQEHDTQNPEHYEEEQGALASIKQMIRDTQTVFNDGFKDVSERIEDWLKDNKPEATIKDSIQNLQESFMENINKLNATIQSYWTQGADTEKQVDIKKVQSSLNVLEEKFENGVETLNNGVRILAAQKLETRGDTTTTAKPSGFPFPGFMATIWNSVSQSFGNVTNQFQNIVGQNNSTQQAASGTQSDEQSGTPAKPTVWQGIQNQIQNIFQNRPGQNQQNQQQGVQSDEQPTSQPSGPFAQVIQNVPFLQNIANFIQPKPQQAEPSKPVESVQPSEGSNIVPAPEGAQSASDPATPETQQQKKPEQQIQPAQAPGPIQQIIQKNPIVQSISGAVQKIQHTITNPEKPRDDAEKKEGDEKGGFFPYYGGKPGHRPGEGDNNDVGASGEVKSVPVESESVPNEAKKVVPVEKKVPLEDVKSAPVEPESAPIEPAKTTPVEAESAPVQALKLEEPLPVIEAVKQD